MKIPHSSILFKIVLFSIGILIFASCAKKPGSEIIPADVPRYSIEQFYENLSLTGGAFSPNETKLLVSSNESGIYNLYEIDLADSSMEQLTFSNTEPLFAIDYVLSTGEILYSADHGGDENDHIFLRYKSGKWKDLTPGENVKAAFAGWSEDKQSFFYRSNKRNPKYFDLFEMETETWKSSLIYQQDDELAVVGVSKDGSKVVLSHPITTSEYKLYIRKASNGDLVEVSESDKPGAYYSFGFNNDGSSFFYSTDVGGEFQALYRFDVASGEREKVYETDWDVRSSYLSENEKFRVISVNEDGKNVLTILDNSTGQEVEMPEVSDGDVLSVLISNSETKMRLRIGTSRSPSDFYIYEFANKDLKRLTKSLNPEIDPNYLVTAEVVRFPSFDGLEIPAIYYKPLYASSENRVPALVWVHGGPGGQTRMGFNQLIQYLVNHGYAVLGVNNRGSSGYGKSFYKMDDRNHGEKDLMDCIYGKKYLQGLDYIDPDRIGIIGGSYGGFMTMAAMTLQPDEFKVGVNIFGVTNWVRTLKAIPPHWEIFKDALYAEMGDPNSEEDSERLHRISPVFHGDKIKGPVMVLQGTNDIRVLQVESDDLVEAIRANDVPVEYVIFPDEGHGFLKKENQINGYGQIKAFLDKYL
ncbi:MAG: S9 family peptidase [Opitutaceae bacterium]|nr:S9 family peptidase [Opitutaceae bacterium]